MSTRRIRLLPELVVNRIAAGEVIERPAAAVKELVENSLDAGAKRIAVRLVEGGIGLIEVIDDGDGMRPDELALAVQRHATSKLHDESLVHINTLGFRGEALPSIGAAAKLSLVSRPRGASEAASIRVEGGAVSEVTPSAGVVGTTVCVADLFYATPARRKFLKAPRQEAEHAEAALRRLAMAAPGVAFRLQIDARVVFDLPAQDAAGRAARLLGPEAAEALIPVALERGGLRLSGFAVRPSVTRATGAGQLLVVNGRPVTDPQLKTAVRVAYRDVIAAGRHAIVALSLCIPAEELDVNVHPAKTELRFRDAAAVRSLVISGLSRALAAPLVPHSLAEFPPDGAPEGVAEGAPEGAPAEGVPEGATMPQGHAWGDAWRAPSGGRPGLRLVYPRAPEKPLERIGPSFAGMAEAPSSFAGASFAGAGYAGAAAWAIDPATDVSVGLLGEAIAQIFDTYIIALGRDGGMVLVDQHAAHERLMQEAFAAQLSRDGVRSQALLLPAVVELPAGAAEALLSEAPALARLGLELEGFGSGAVLVRAMPALLGAPDPAPLLRDIADELAEWGETTALAARLDAVVARMACHGSIRAGRRLNRAEMNALLRQMEASPRAATCSHGRPTYLTFARADFERMFGRR